MSNSLPKFKTKERPMRRSISDVDLLRLVDMAIFGEQAAKLTPHELDEARKTEIYKMLQRMGIQMYRSGEKGLRPKPALMAVDSKPDAQEPVPATEDQPEPATTP
jgi:hypothetical protein